MASSDDEGEAVPHTVSNYHFVDENDKPISFSELPVQWNESESLNSKKKQIFLNGTTDNGLQKIYKQVIAWTFNLSNSKPEISVLSKENNWIKLQKPRKSFEEMIRTVLITLHYLHFLKKDPESSGKALWDHLSNVFSLYKVRPSKNDLMDHMNLVNKAVQMDKALAKSKSLVTFLKEKSKKRKAFSKDVRTTTKSVFIEDDGMMAEIEEDGPDDEEDLFDSVCAICDNGGELVCCEGRCFRSFHATKEVGSDSMCESVGLSDEQVEEIQNFVCKNCQYKQHQCFSCGDLGLSDKSSGAQVFSCVSANCGRFYHPHCVAKLLHRDSEADVEKLQRKIASGKTFTCPAHKCCICEQRENKKDPELQFAMCRRCPKSYHRKCLPRTIAFEDIEEEGIKQRAWEGLMPNQILMYCLNHELDDDLLTPVRNHIKFPFNDRKKKIQEPKLSISREKVPPKGRSLVLHTSGKRRDVKSPKRVEKISLAIQLSDSSKRNRRRLPGSNSSTKDKVMNNSRKILSKTSSVKGNQFIDESKTTLKDMLYSLLSRDSEPSKLRKEGTSDSEHEKTQTLKRLAKKTSRSLPLDADAKRRTLALMKDAASSTTLEAVAEKPKLLTTHAYSSKPIGDKTITHEKVEGSIEALHADLQKVEEGCSIEDAKTVREPELFYQITKWKDKLKVDLAPFLHGKHYTSFGPHFTKVDKLKEIVEKLHWYVQDGDMVVDFCCGSNDFSCLMKEKLDEMGKNCSYKNYDILQAKNDFKFEKDWMSVRRKELPTGSRLIVGLNPPFGVNAALANKFIDKALEFKPKLLVLVVPPETERLDKEEAPYDLVWEDDEFLVRKSFYLAGSVDVNDKPMEDWNGNAPPSLYLWSRPDWTAKHQTLAQQHGHISKLRDKSSPEENGCETRVFDSPTDNDDLIINGRTPMLVDDQHVGDEAAQLQERGDSLNGFHHKEESLKEESLLNNGGMEGEKEDNNQNGRSSMPRHFSPNICGGDRPFDGQSSEHLQMLSNTVAGKRSHGNFELSSISGSPLQIQTVYGTCDDEIARTYSFSSEPPCSELSQRWSHDASPCLDKGMRNSVESDTRPQVQLYGQQDPDSLSQQENDLAIHGSAFSSSPNENLASAAASSYSVMQTSTMLQSATQLDALNHDTKDSLGSEQHLPCRSSMSDPRPPRPRFRIDSLGFAPGPRRPFSENNSAGWLDE